MSREHPILFKAPLVRAILAGKKTQTRRIIKPDNCGHYRRFSETSGKAIGWMDEPLLARGFERPHRIGFGDRLWVREAVRAEEMEDGLDGVRYLADGHFEPIENTKEAGEQWVQLNGYRHGDGLVVPSIHAPRWTSRIDLLVTGVRAESLQAISDDDAKAEGVKLYGEGRLQMPAVRDAERAKPKRMGRHPRRRSKRSASETGGW